MYKYLFSFAFALPALGSYAQQILRVDNASIVSSPGTKIVLNGGISFNGSSNFIDSGEIRLAPNSLGGGEDWVDNTATGVYSNNSIGTVVFMSDSLQHISGPTKFYNLTINVDTGVFLDNTIETRNQLNLEKGFIYVNSPYYKYVSNPAVNAIQSSTSYTNSWVMGKLRRVMNSTASAYLFPVGKALSGYGNLYAPVQMQKINTNSTYFDIEYFTGLPYDRFNILLPPLDHISQLEWWEIESPLTASVDDDCIVSLSYRTYSQVSSSATFRDSLLVAHYRDNSGFRWEPEHNMLAPTIVSGTASFGYVTSNITVSNFNTPQRRFTLGTLSPSNILPVTLLNWNATKENNRVLLDWKVENDVSVSRYEVEKSLNGRSFYNIGSVNSSRNTGSSYYSLYDNNPVKGDNYYRLKIFDDANQYRYTDIRKIFFGDDRGWSLYPNPAIDHVYLNSTTNTTGIVQLFTENGVLLKQTVISSNNTSIELKGLSAATYFIRVIDETGKKVLFTSPVVKHH
jgi:hypothetical protein